MFKLRNVQMKAIWHPQDEAFRDEMIAYLRRFFRAECEQFTPEALRIFVDQGVASARKHKLSTKRDICKYLCLRIYLGADFEERPESEWMQAYFRDPDVPQAGNRIDRIIQEQIQREERRLQVSKMWEDFANERAAEIKRTSRGSGDQ